MPFRHEQENDLNLEAQQREDALLMEGLAPLRELVPPPELRVRNRRRLQALLEEVRIGNRLARRTPWWRRRLVVPWPVAVCAGAFMLGLVLFDLPGLINQPQSKTIRPDEAAITANSLALSPASAAAASAFPPVWHLENSPVIMDGSRLLGRVTFSGGPLLVLSGAGLGRWELSTVPFPGALPAGQLHGGRMTVGRMEVFGIRTVGAGSEGTIWIRRQPDTEAIAAQPLQVKSMPLPQNEG